MCTCSILIQYFCNDQHTINLLIYPQQPSYSLHRLVGLVKKEIKLTLICPYEKI